MKNLLKSILTLTNWAPPLSFRREPVRPLAEAGGEVKRTFALHIFFVRSHKALRYSGVRVGIAASIFIFFAFQSCDRDKNNPGYDYFPDMAYSNACETYAPNANFPDGKTLQAPVEGTYSREGEYYPYKKTDADLLKAAQFKNPFLPDTEIIARGKVVYQNICLQCHGANGDGKGHLFTSGKYSYPPANLLDQKIKNLTDGQMFHVITVGFGIMEPHYLMVRPNDRWKTVLYVRSLEKKTP